LVNLESVGNVQLNGIAGVMNCILHIFQKCLSFKLNSGLNNGQSLLHLLFEFIHRCHEILCRCLGYLGSAQRFLIVISVPHDDVTCIDDAFPKGVVLDFAGLKGTDIFQDVLFASHSIAFFSKLDQPISSNHL